jgi:hypothetical protein
MLYLPDQKSILQEAGVPDSCRHDTR